MFGFSIGEMVFIMALALIFIGPKQMPEVARTIGKLLNELKRTTGDFKRQFTDVQTETRNTWQRTQSEINTAFTAGAKPYEESVRAPPDGTFSSHINGTSHDHGLQHGVDPHAPHGFEVDPQASLFTDPQPHAPETVRVEQAAPVVEEQLSFKLGDGSGDHS